MDALTQAAADNKGNARFLTMSYGKFTYRVDEDSEKDPGVRARVLEKGDNAGKTVYERVLQDFIGKLVEVRVEENKEYGDRWVLEIDVDNIEGQVMEEAQRYVLKLNYSSGYANCLLDAFPNIKLDQRIWFKGYDFQDKKENKRRVGFTMWQAAGGKAVKVEKAYTKDEPNGRPELKKIKVKGKDTWDDSERLEFHRAIIEYAYPADALPADQDEDQPDWVKEGGEGAEEMPY